MNAHPAPLQGREEWGPTCFLMQLQENPFEAQFLPEQEGLCAGRSLEFLKKRMKAPSRQFFAIFLT